MVAAKNFRFDAVVASQLKHVCKIIERKQQIGSIAIAVDAALDEDGQKRLLDAAGIAGKTVHLLSESLAHALSYADAKKQ